MQFAQFINTDFGMLALPPSEAAFLTEVAPLRKDGQPDRRTTTGRIAAHYIADQIRLAERVYIEGGQLQVAQTFPEWRKAAS